MLFAKLVEQVIETSWSWLHDVTPHPSWLQSSNAFSLPLQTTSSNHIVPFPEPYMLPILSPERLQQLNTVCYSFNTIHVVVGRLCLVFQST